MPDPYWESGLPKLTKEKRYLVEMVEMMMAIIMMKKVMNIWRV